MDEKTGFLQAAQRATEIAELHQAGFIVRRGVNDLRAGIAAVSARLEDGRLRVLAGRFPNLLAEAGMYRWGASEDRCAEVPVDEHNHALAALRYLIATLDRRRLGSRQCKAEPAVNANKTREEWTAEEQARCYSEMMFSDDDKIWWPLG